MDTEIKIDKFIDTIVTKLEELNLFIAKDKGSICKDTIFTDITPKMGIEDFIELIMMLEEEFNIMINDRKLSQGSTVNDMLKEFNENII